MKWKLGNIFVWVFLYEILDFYENCYQSQPLFVMRVEGKRYVPKTGVQRSGKSRKHASNRRSFGQLTHLQRHHVIGLSRKLWVMGVG